MKGETLADAPIERIRRYLVGLRMPRALEMLDHLVQQIERGQVGTIEAIEILLAEELTIRESRRIKAALQMGAVEKLAFDRSGSSSCAHVPRSPTDAA
jgi:hypothetical protein